MATRPRLKARLAAERLEDRTTPTVSFGNGASYSVPGNARSVASGDFNGDGTLDVVIGSSGGVTTFLNDGSGTLTNATDMGTGSAAPESLRVADINDDGNLDILVGNSFGKAISILTGRGNGTFRAPIVVDAGGVVQGFVVADFNGDDKLDVAAAEGDRFVVLLNTGGATILGAPTIFGLGQLQLSLGIDSADFDGDGSADLAVADFQGNRITTFEGRGNGTFAAGVNYPTGAGSAPAGMIARDATGQTIDFNRDGKADLATGYTGNGFVGILLGNGTGGFITPDTFATGYSRVGRLVAADFDSDGKLDLALPVNDGTYSRNPMLLGNGSGGFATPITVPYTGDTDLAAPDLNGDGQPDMIGSFSFSPGSLGVAINTTFVFNPPIASNDSITVAEDSGTVAIDVLANDSTAPDTGETLTILSVNTSGTQGVVQITGGGSGLTFAPASNFFGTTTFTYTIDDGTPSRSVTATVTVTVAAVNDPPTANANAFGVAEDSAATAINVLANDSFAPDAGETLTILTVDTTGTQGVVQITGGGSGLTFAPASNFFGTTTFTYTIGDGTAGSTATATVTMTVTSVNDPPTTNPDILTLAEDSPATVVGVLANDSFAPDVGETLSVTAITQPARGVATLTGGVVRYTPTANYNGPDSFNYTISDGNGGTASSTVTVSVTSVNDPPTANSNSHTIAEDSGANAIDVLANDSIAPDSGETLSILSVNTVGTQGVVQIAGGGSGLTFSPAANFFGTTTFTYSISDGNGGTATGAVNVTVTSVNDPPTANPDPVTVAEDSPATVVNVRANDSFAPDTGETLTVTAVTQPAFGVATLIAGVVRYTPTANYNGPDSFTYTLSDGNGGTATGTVNVTVTSVNDLPTANPDSLTIAEDSPATVVGALTNDTFTPDVGETLSATSVTQPANGAVTLIAGVIRYTPAANYNGPDSFTYNLSDGNGGIAIGTVNVTVTPINDPPVANPDALTLAEDDPATVVNVLANDTIAPDVGETLTVTAVTQPAHGVVAFTVGIVQYSPTANYNGPDSFTYTISDGNGGTATATVNVTVTSVNDLPTANPDPLTVDEDSPAAAVDVLPNDTIVPDLGETLSVTAVTQPAHGAVTLTGGIVQYSPAANYNGPDSFTYTINDGNGGTATGTVNVTVTSVNDLPTASNDSLTLAEDSPAIVVNALATDSSIPDVGETLTVSAVTQPLHGAATLVAGIVRYAPTANYNGPDSFTYTISDGNGGTATASVTVTVTPVNDSPIANADTPTIREGNGATIVDVLGNDSFAPDAGEALSAIAITQPTHGSVTLMSGAVRYTPGANFNGTDTFTYTLSDGNGGTAIGTVNVRVTPLPVDVAPFLLPDGDVASSYSRTITASGPVGPFAFAITAGALPAGFVLASSGQLSGITTVAGSFSFTVTATASPTDFGSRDYAFEIIPAPVQLTISGRPDGSAAQYRSDATGKYTLNSVVNPLQGAASASRTAVADVNGDGVPDTIFVTGPGVPIRLAVINGADNTRLMLPIDPFGGDFTGGGFVAAADFDGDGRAEMVVTPDRGGGPRVSIYSLPGRDPVVRANYFTVDPDFRGGARVAAGDVNGDGVPDLAVVAGFGGGPRVALIDGTKALTTNGFDRADRLLNDFFAFEDRLRNGVYIAIGDIDGDGFGDLVMGAGPGGGPRVLTLSGQQLLQQGALAAIDSPLSNFLVANADSDRGGVRVAVTDADVDGFADVAVSTGEGQPGRVRVYLGKNFGGGEPSAFQDLDPFQNAIFADGVFVG